MESGDIAFLIFFAAVIMISVWKLGFISLLEIALGWILAFMFMHMYQAKVESVKMLVQNWTRKG